MRCVNQGDEKIEMKNKHAGALLGFVLGVIVGELMYYITDHLVFFTIVIFMSLLGWVLGAEVDIKESESKKL